MSKVERKFYAQRGPASARFAGSDPATRSRRNFALIGRFAWAMAAVGAGPLGCSSSGDGVDTVAGGMGPTGSSGAAAGSTTQSGSGGMPSAGQASGGSSQPTGGAAPSAGAAAGGAAPSGGVGQGGASPSGGGGAAGGDTSLAGSGGSPGPACPKPEGQLCHTFIINDNAHNEVTYVDEFDASKPSGVVWSQSVGATGSNSPRALELVDNAKAAGGKAVLVSVDNGYLELSLEDGSKVAQVTVGFNGITGACRMPDGTTALGTNAAIRIVDASGAQLRQVALPEGMELRAINRHPTTGNFWFSKMERIYEVTEQGQTVWDANLGTGSKGYAVWWRAGGGAYATTGDPSTVLELDADGKIVSTIGGKSKFNFLDFLSGFARLSNGNYVVSNWLGHLTQPPADAPHVVEFSRNNEVVWRWGNQTLARQITNVLVIR